MKAAVLMVTTTVIAPFAAYADCLQKAADFAQKICGELQTMGRSTLVTASGDLTGEAKHLIVKALVQFGGTVEGNEETKTFENVLREQLAGELLNLRQCNIQMAQAAWDQVCTKAPVWKTCSNKEFGLAGWENEEALNGASGWRDRSYNQKAYCAEFIDSVIQARGLSDLPHLVDEVRPSEENRRTGFFNSVSQYNYHCSIKLHWNPIYNQKADPICGLQ
jgi:hypothetical protein